MMRFRMASALVIVVVGVLLVPTVGAADDGPMPLTWVGMVKLNPGTGPQFEQAFEKYNRPLFDQMVADGKAMSWGLGYELAGPGGFDYVMWITMPGWAGMGAVEAAFDAQYESLSEEELATMIADWTAVTQPGENHNDLLRHTVFKGTPGADFKYLRLSAYTVNPGYGEDLMNMYKSFNVPTYEKLLEEGVISGYGMIQQAVHSDTSFTHEAWITFAELADLEKVEKAFDEREISDGDEAARDIAFRKIMKTDSHFDRLIRVTKHSN